MVDYDKDPRNRWETFRYYVEIGEVPEDEFCGTSKYIVWEDGACCGCWEFFEDTGRGHAVKQAPDKRFHHALFDVDGELIQECCVKCAHWIDTEWMKQNRPGPSS